MFLKEFIKHRKYVLFIIANYYYFTIIHVHVLHYSFYRTVGNLDTPIESEYQNNDEGEGNDSTVNTGSDTLDQSVTPSTPSSSKIPKEATQRQKGYTYTCILCV